MPNPSLTQRIKDLPERFARIMDDPSATMLMERADRSKGRLQSLLPLDGVEESALEQYDRDWLARYVYNSNAIEGSTLSLEDTELVMEGEFIPADSPARYIFAARGVADGMEYVKRYVKERHPLDITVIRRLHEVTALDVQPVLRGEFRPYGYMARIRGTSVKTADPLEIWEDLEALLDAAGMDAAHPIIKASAFHAMFENIHPFADGNGRTGRQILNMMLMQEGYRPIAIKHDAGRTYAEHLEQWQVHDDPMPLLETIVDCVDHEQSAVADLVSNIRNGADMASRAVTLPEPDPSVQPTECQTDGTHFELD